MKVNTPENQGLFNGVLHNIPEDIEIALNSKQQLVEVWNKLTPSSIKHNLSIFIPFRRLEQRTRFGPLQAKKMSSNLFMDTVCSTKTRRLLKFD